MLSRARLLHMLGACGAAAGAARTVTLAQSPVTIKIGCGVTEGNAQAFYAYERGFFKRNGLDAELTILRSGNPVMEGIVAGQLHAGGSNSVSLGSAILRAIPFVVVAPGQLWVAGSPSAAIVVAADSPMRSAKDLAGKTVATISLRNVGELAFDAYLDHAGVDVSAVKFIELPPAQVAEAVASGRVAAGTITDPQLADAVAAGKVRRLAGAYDAIAKQFYLTLWFSSRDWLARNKESAKRFVEAVLAGGIWGEANREQAGAILGKYSGAHDARPEAVFGHRMDPALLQAIWTPAYSYKIYDAPLRAAEYCWDGK